MTRIPIKTLSQNRAWQGKRQRDTRKLSDEEIQMVISEYARIRNVWKVGELLGLKGQRVHSILNRNNINTDKDGKWTNEQVEELKSLYADGGFLYGDDKIKNFCKKHGKLKSNVCRKAKELGLKRSRSRKYSDRQKAANSIRAKAWIKREGHPRGALGMKHTAESKEKIAAANVKKWQEMSEDDKSEQVLKMMKTKLEKYGKLAVPRENVTWKQGWRTIGGIKKYYRSRWEANYARYLEFLKQHGEIQKWEHEPETFWFEKIKRGCRSYLIDFRVTEKNGEVIYHEVKGWMDDRSKTKLARMKKYYPHIKIRIIDGKWFKENTKRISPLIPDWEHDEKNKKAA